jgi:hypothetical protein
MLKSGRTCVSNEDLPKDLANLLLGYEKAYFGALSRKKRTNC